MVEYEGEDICHFYERFYGTVIIKINADMRI